MHSQRASIYAIGTFLPDAIRTNDWWPKTTVSQWKERRERHMVAGARTEAEVVPPGGDLVLREMAAVREDLFNGVVERRIASESLQASDMETAAARDALAKAGIDPNEIGLLLSYSVVPDYITVPVAAQVHKNLGLNRACFSMAVDAGCNSFLMQLCLAEQMIGSGQVKYALLLQSSLTTRVLRQEDPQSAWFGDGATAVVVGPSQTGGIIGRAHRTDGSYYRSLVLGVPGRRWYSDGEAHLYSEDRASGRRMVLSLPMLGKEVIDAALLNAEVEPNAVDFFASHQGTGWLRRVAQEYVGMTRARGVDTFSWTGSLTAANIPFVLALGQKEGLLKSGDVVAMYAGGSGIVFSSVVLRWGI